MIDEAGRRRSRWILICVVAVVGISVLGWLRLHVDSTSVSCKIPLDRNSSAAFRDCSAVNDTRSLTSTGAVR